ncbi:MAG: universal stress protein [Thermodesulfovibrionales bacterium]|nr:universal stress protein [Thermodesulfovibrionales bacterium]
MSGKKVLICVDGSDNALKGVKVAGRTDSKGVEKFTLLQVVETPATRHYFDLAAEHVSRRDMGELLAKQFEQAKVDSESYLKEAKDALIETGVPAEKIEVKMRPGRPAEEIMAEAEEGMYDEIYIGRRGLGKIKELFIGSVSKEVSQRATKSTVVLV